VISLNFTSLLPLKESLVSVCSTWHPYPNTPF